LDEWKGVSAFASAVIEHRPQANAAQECVSFSNTAARVLDISVLTNVSFQFKFISMLKRHRKPTVLDLVFIT